MSRRPHPLVTELATIRQRQGLTQHALANRSGLHISMIATMEAGWRVPSLPTLIAYASALGCEIAVVPAAEVEERRAS